jgi:hypothetical protein
MTQYFSQIKISSKYAVAILVMAILLIQNLLILNLVGARFGKCNLKKQHLKIV